MSAFPMLTLKVIYHRSDAGKVLQTHIYVDVCTVAATGNAHQDEVDKYTVAHFHSLLHCSKVPHLIQ